MSKTSLPPKGSASGRPLTESTSPEPAAALPREIAGSTRPTQPKAVADSELDRPEDGVDPTLPENTAHGAPGHQVKEPPSEDEDDEGRSTTEQLIDAGAQEAEQDKVAQAKSAATRNNRSWPPPGPGRNLYTWRQQPSEGEALKTWELHPETWPVIGLRREYGRLEDWPYG